MQIATFMSKLLNIRRGFSDAEQLSARKKMLAFKRRETARLEMTHREWRAWSAWWPVHEPWDVPALYYSAEELEKMIEAKRGVDPLFPKIQHEV